MATKSGFLINYSQTATVKTRAHNSIVIEIQFEIESHAIFINRNLKKSIKFIFVWKNSTIVVDEKQVVVQ